MMKHLNEYIKESLFDVDDRNLDKTIKDEIEKFIGENYKTKQYSISETPGEDGRYIVNSKYDVVVKNQNLTTLTSNLFVWGKVDRWFSCNECKSLTSLKGAPKRVGNDFECIGCLSLVSLEDAPKEVGRDFVCIECKSLTSLKGAPKEIGGKFDCRWCDSLTSLEGAPEKVRDFTCNWCESLTSLKGAPKEVGRDFDCHDCKVQFVEDDVRKVTNVKGTIRCL